MLATGPATSSVCTFTGEPMRTNLFAAALAAFAIAALLGVILPSDNAVHAADPVFGSGNDSRSVPENTPPGVNIGNPISATDADEGTVEYGQTLTYTLGGTDAASFDIDTSTGQLITKAPLNFETKDRYSVTVTVDDGETRNSPITQEVTISVTDVDEPPAAPVPPTVVSRPDDTDTDDVDESTTGLKVVWHAPDNTGDAITGYNVQYKKTTELRFGSDNVSVDGTTATIGSLTADTSYHVRVRAVNGEGNGPWSLVGTGSTNKDGNSPPAFRTGDDTRSVFENAPAGENVGEPVTADDADASTLTYRLEGPDAALFAFVTSSGQIRTRSSLNHEDPDCGYVSTDSTTTCAYNVTVAVSDGAGGSDAKAVDIEIQNRSEPVPAPASPAVRPTEESSTSLDVNWSAPANTGPPITGYDVRYREVGGTTFLDDDCGSDDDDNCNNITTGTKTTIIGLTASKSHQVQVRTIIAGGSKSGWSDTGTGSTNKANSEPRFDDRPSSPNSDNTHLREPPADQNSDPTYTITRNVDENTRSGQSVGRAVRAEDGDGHKRTYRLVDTADGNNDGDAAKFDIDASTGQIKTKAALDHESADCDYDDTDNPTVCTYTVKVEVWDGFDTHKVEEDSDSPTVDDAIKVKITVRDKDEAPAVPTLTVTSPSGNVTLDVVWGVPANTGPAITGYDVQYRKGSAAFSDDKCGSAEDDTCTGIGATTTTITIQGLDANTSYSVQVRAKNAEGVSAWSRLVTVKTNKGDNAPPAFTGESTTLTVAENTRSGTLVGTVTADDGDSTTWKYSLEGADAASFTINTSTGEIKTRSSLDFEEKASYSVRVRANDGSDGGSASHAVTITVTDVDEPPSKPAAPRVTATKDSGWSLDVTWNEPPQNAGKPAITDYDIRYRKFGQKDEADWKLWPHGADSARSTGGNTKRSATITRVAPANDAAHLDPKTQYEVEVRASNAEGTSDWSSIGRGTTGAGNSRPVFDRTEALVTLKVDENTRSGQNVGSAAVSATDADGNRLRYSLEGPNKDSFTIVSSSGQIKTKAALDYESRSSYSLTIKVDDGQKRANSVAAKSVRIAVEDVDEVPPAPAAPAVAGIPGSTDSVRVSWDASANTGPPVTDYEVRWGVSGSGGWTTLVGRSGADRSQIITGLTAGTRYEVQVRTKSAEGTSDWSSSGSGTPNPDAANRNPTFSGGARTLSVAENTAAGTDIGAPVAATDPDGDTLTYTLEGRDAASFSILSTGTGGQIQTSAALNHEKKSSHSVTVRVTDGRGGSNTANITITVTDVNGEAPEIPFAPTVTAVSSTSLQVTWDAPGNEGPPITDYDYRYKKTSTWTEVTATTITATSVTIDGLTASTFYDVEVRATNAEGTSDWSNSGNGTTNAPGANSIPVFTEGTSAERSIHQTAAAGASIGDPVGATDADSDDKLTYTLEGTDVASFGITSTTGQLLTKSGVTLTEPGTTYAVTVVASDGKDSARITVTITVTAAPPNRPPSFAGASASRSVAETAGPGASVGGPVTATDPDEGDTLAYTLGGADAGLFAIGGGTGQITVGAGTTLDYETRTSYTVVVTATDPDAESAAITVTINVLDVGSGPYDSNDDGRIDRSEVIAAVVDYFSNRTDRATVIDLIRQYFAS